MITLAIIGWVVLGSLLLTLITIEGITHSYNKRIPLVLIGFFGLWIAPFVIISISMGLHYDIFGDFGDLEGNTSLFRISGYIALGIASVGFILLSIERSKTRNNSRPVANNPAPTLDQKKPRSDITIVQMFELIAAIVGIIASILAIVAFYQAN